jgi:hypothetical protein
VQQQQILKDVRKPVTPVSPTRSYPAGHKNFALAIESRKRQN